MKAIADTGFIVAFASSDDVHHQWALEVAARVSLPALTCESVLSEAAFHLRSSDVVLDMIEAQLVRPEFDVSDNLSQLSQLAKRYRDRTPDFADLCLIRMSELFPKHTLLTVDETDFRVYRRNRREVIPLLCPTKQ